MPPFIVPPRPSDEFAVKERMLYEAGAIDRSHFSAEDLEVKKAGFPAPPA
jgi:hypothetical protein